MDSKDKILMFNMVKELLEAIKEEDMLLIDEKLDTLDSKFNEIWRNSK